MNENKGVKNYGVILGSREGDWIAGGISGITYEEVLPSGDWTPYLPLEEWQWHTIGFDTMACVSFSALNVLETLYFFKTGVRRNFSDRFTAIMSGTMKIGNYLWKVGDSIRKDGLVDEADYPMIDNPTWDTYYVTPPIEVINKAKEFLKEWEVHYEVIDFTRESLLKHIKQAPIQVVIPGHAVMNFLTTDQIYKYFDSYAPFQKDRPEGFIFAQKYVLLPITNKPMYTLYKDPLKTSEIYAFGNGYKRHIANLYTIRKGKGKEWEYENEGTIPFADMAVFANIPEAEEICFLPNDSQA